jgi:hypothetical protein
MDSGRRKKLHLTFHGRIIDSLGIQMHQSPVAAVADDRPFAQERSVSK